MDFCVSSLSDLSPQSFVKCKSMTRVVMANRLCEALKLIDGCQKKILDLENSYDQLDEASLVACDENVKLVKQFFFSNNFNFCWSIISQQTHTNTHNYSNNL